jgi:NTP pyrophosphatase (non-canonical NTP hydrolase)
MNPTPGPAPEPTDLDSAVHRARRVRALYEILEERQNGQVWSLHELVLGFVNDVGTVGRLVLARDGTWDIDGDVRAQLQQKLVESMWWVMVLADRLDIDMADAFVSTMDRIEADLQDAVGRTAPPSGDGGPRPS